MSKNNLFLILILAAIFFTTGVAMARAEESKVNPFGV